MNPDEATAAQVADPVGTVMGLALGYLVSRSLFVATELGIADALGDGPKPVVDLAAATGCNAAALQRLLRCLAAHGVFTETAPGHFGLTAAASLLRHGVMRDGVLLCGEVTGDGSWWSAAGAMSHSVRSGEPAFDRQHGMGFFDYMARHPECSAWFDRGLANFAAAENPSVAMAIAWPQGAHVVDVGGGQGGLLAELLSLRPDLRATLFDLPTVVCDPRALATADIAGRWQTVAGDFFAAVPTGGNVYLLKRILHDWDDEACVRILQQCRRAMPDDAHLVVADAVIEPGNDFQPGKVMDLLMLVFGPGRERTRAEFEQLFARSGFELIGITTTATPVAVIEARPV
jgi:hypothetical protein